MTIRHRRKGDVVILDVSGKMTLSNSGRFDSCFRERLEEGARLFIFNLREVPLMDSASVGTVVACHKRVQRHGGLIRLVLNERGHDLFTVYELQRVFGLFDDVEAALASFVGQPVPAG